MRLGPGEFTFRSARRSTSGPRRARFDIAVARHRNIGLLSDKSPRNDRNRSLREGVIGAGT
jgi:hypothetical protein